MSSDSSIANSLPSILGGVPTKHQDLAASIIMAVLFAAILPLAAWRLFSPASRSRVLIRPAIFAVFQLAAYILRALIANGNQSTGLYITSQILLLAGFFLVCEPIIALLTRVVGKYQKGVEHPHQKQQIILRLLRILLVAALAVGIAAASLIGDGTSVGITSTMKDLRVANAILVIIAMAGAMLMAAVFFVGNMTPRASLLVAGQGLCILVSAIYKLYAALHDQNPLATSTKVEFYILCAVLQWIAALGYFVVNLEIAFPLADSSKVVSGEEYDEDGQSNPAFRWTSTAVPLKEAV